MELQQRMITKIDALCGHQEFTSQLRKYSKLTPPKDKIRYVFTINAINELYMVKNVNVKFNTRQHKRSVVKSIQLFKNDNLIFKCSIVSLLIELMEYNLEFIQDAKRLH